MSQGLILVAGATGVDLVNKGKFNSSHIRTLPESFPTGLTTQVELLKEIDSLVESAGVGEVSAVVYFLGDSTISTASHKSTVMPSLAELMKALPNKKAKLILVYPQSERKQTENALGSDYNRLNKYGKFAWELADELYFEDVAVNTISYDTDLSATFYLTGAILNLLNQDYYCAHFSLVENFVFLRGEKGLTSLELKVTF